MVFASDILYGRAGQSQGFASNLLGLISQKIASRRAFVKTRNELSMLSNRTLADLGLTRGEIHSIAYEAAYGKRA